MSWREQKTIAAGDGVKLAIRHEGWYQVTREELMAAGLARSANSRNLQLFVDGIEQPLLVVGKETDSAGSFEAVEFYGVGTGSPYSDLRTYYLVAGKQPGRRIPVIHTNPDSTGAKRFPFTVERKERSIYFSALLNGNPRTGSARSSPPRGSSRPSRSAPLIRPHRQRQSLKSRRRVSPSLPQTPIIKSRCRSIIR